MYIDLSENKDMKLIEPKVLGALGLARRAGKLVIGTEMCEESVKNGSAQITFIASNISQNSEKKIKSVLKNTDSPYMTLQTTKEELAAKLGKKAFAAAVSITDKGFAEIIRKALGNQK